MIRPERVRLLNSKRVVEGPVIYWMSRDQRISDNWAFLYAQKLAIKNKSPLAVLFHLSPKFLGAGLRQYMFMIEGLKEVETRLKEMNIPFFILSGNNKLKAGAVVTDFNPLKISRSWKQSFIKGLDCAFYEVDSHNIVPCWFASDKQEYGAHTIRPKINRELEIFLEEFPKMKAHPYKWDKWVEHVDWDDLVSKLECDKDIKPVKWIKPGGRNAKKALKHFIDEKLDGYDEKRNDPTLDAQSGLSPYLHFGQISAQRIALEVQNSKAPKKDKDAFLEELIVRRELSDNFCLYNDSYDNSGCAPVWARTTLKEHAKDKREYIYNLKQLETAKTHDDLWNAAQMEMVKTGRMHGYLRMYWCKKILEWTKSAEEAFSFAVALNDKYQLDGRDPNGYAGIAWSICGVHDRAWGEHPVFGKIRFMNYNGSSSKFNIKAYIDKVKKL